MMLSVNFLLGAVVFWSFFLFSFLLFLLFTLPTTTHKLFFCLVSPPLVFVCLFVCLFVVRVFEIKQATPA